ncbi:glycoside hydrolase family 5 protein [Klebsiella aerogenes]|uniref:glycosyl hydrolase n=1 Tax=Klebsiella aerogenes TaxID=548 RepID=UPI00186773D3|nr:glycosyl hydrolase [Klebsiella aerogenes]MDG0005262.1 glycoside hydrolase family 5 protein [Klebsiella aerogenes]HEP1062503.1 hypothetical protein [Klebsiella aerogenes]
MKNVLKMSSCLSCLLISSLSYGFEKGVNVHPDQFPGTSDDIIKILNSYNISSFRTDYSWGQLEKKPGLFVPLDNKTNELINKASEVGVKPLLVLGYGNSIYRIDRPVTVEQINKYVTYSSWVAKHFKGKVYAYEIWNEWDHLDKKRDDNSLSISATNYCNLVKAVSIAIRKNDPSTKIIAGGFNPTNGDSRKWGDMIVNCGILQYVDGISLHPYDFGSQNKVDKQDTFLKINEQYNAWKNKTGIATKIFITEFGYSSYNGKYHYSAQQIKSTITNYLISAKKYSYIEGVWYYELIDKGNNKNDIESNFGLLNSTKSPKEQINSFLQ